MKVVDTKDPEREAEELSPDELQLRREAEARPLRMRSQFCRHGLLPEYCAHCKFGELVDGEFIKVA